MTPTTLRFRARGTSLVPDHELEAARIRAFIGRRLVEVKPGVTGFAPTNETSEHPYRAEYVKACKDGCLYAADEETARACGVAFDPTFGDAPAGRTRAELSDESFGSEPKKKGGV